MQCCIFRLVVSIVSFSLCFSQHLCNSILLIWSESFIFLPFPSTHFACLQLLLMTRWSQMLMLQMEEFILICLFQILSKTMPFNGVDLATLDRNHIGLMQSGKNVCYLHWSKQQMYTFTQTVYGQDFPWFCLCYAHTIHWNRTDKVLPP